MFDTLGELEGVAAYIDDILIYDRTLDEHNTRLDKFKEIIFKSGFTLNLEHLDSV